MKPFTYNQETHALVLRCNAPDGTSHKGFQWPLEVGAEVVAPDWIANNECGNGLHGWLHGAGDHSVSAHSSTPGATWLVVCVALADIVLLGDKVKFSRCVVHHVGDRTSAADYIIANDDRAKLVPVIGAKIVAGDKQVANVGSLGVAIGGNSSTLTGGHYSTLTGGDSSTLTGGDCSTLTGGHYSTLTGGYSSTLTGGDSSKVMAGDKSEIRIRYYDKKADRMRTKVGYIGEDGLLPNVFYTLNYKHEFVVAV